ncbi:MAG: hypothetical protein U0S36_04645 [Candidatus Nanopelagicales bacterium]|jgi:hypothetical protein
MSDRHALEAAVSAAAERLAPGSGASAADHFKNEIGMVSMAQDASVKRYARGDIRLVVPAIVEAKQPDGDPVAIAKGRDGLVVVLTEGIVVVRGIAFGARESKGYALSDVTAERITTVLDGAQVPGVRIAGRHGKPKLALAIALEEAQTLSEEQAALADELVALLSG